MPGYVDSSAAIGMSNRKGNGKLRHVKVGIFWIQERVEEGDIDMRKIAGEENPADLMTKNLPERKIEKFMDMLNQHYALGYASMGLRI